MTNKINFRKYLPYIVAIFLFFAIAYIYCFPVFQGLKVHAGDSDSAQQAYQEGVQYSRSTGEYSWWTGALFSGMPNYQIGGGRYTSSVALKPFARIFLPAEGPGVIVLYFVCFFCLFLAFKVDKWLAIVGALAMGFSSYFFIIIPAGHWTKSITIPLMSLVIAGFYLIFRKNYLAGVPIVMLFMALCFHRHPQMSYYIFMLIGLLWIAELAIHIKEKRYKDFLISTTLFAGAVLVGLFSNTANTLANKEYMTQTMRGGHSDLVEETAPADQKSSSGLDYDYAMEWSYGKTESLSFLIPGIQGSGSAIKLGPKSHYYQALSQHRMEYGLTKQDIDMYCQSAPMYWGNQIFTVGNVYMGAVVCLLFVLGLLVVSGPYKWALAIATALSVMLSWGHNIPWLTHLFFDYFPLFNKFRAISSILIVAEITMPLLGFLAVKEILDKKWEKEELCKRLFIAAGITGIICLVIFFGATSFFDFKSRSDAGMPDWLTDAIILDRIALTKNDALRSFIFVLLTTGIIWLYATKKLTGINLIFWMGVLVLADMWPIDHRYFNKSDFAVVPNAQTDVDKRFPLQAYEKQILADTDPHFRVLNLASNTFNENRTSVRLKSIGGYSAAKLRRYQDIIDVYLSGQQPNMKIVSMLNGKYLIVPQQQNGNRTTAVFRNSAAMGNAWFVDSIRIAESPHQECMDLDIIDLHTTAIVGQDYKDAVQGFENGDHSQSTITFDAYTPKSLDYHYTSDKDGIVVFSEIFYPFGWKATIDGQSAELFRANYLLRALRVPAGEHSISMVFDPDSIRKGNVISLVMIILIYMSILGSATCWFLKKRKEGTTAE